MFLHRTIIYLLVLAIFFSAQSLVAQQNNLKVEELPPLPDEEGFAGMFAGTSNGALLCMGGANFPEARPWEGGQKRWYDHIYVLMEEDGDWQVAGQKLPYPLAYGVSVNYQNEVILIGGSDAKKHHREVFSVSYENGAIKINHQFPSLPVPLASMAGTIVNNTIYIAGGISTPESKPIHKFYALDLSLPENEREWTEESPWPGAPRMLAVSAAKDGKFYLFSGINLLHEKGEPYQRELLKDAYVYHPSKTKESQDGKWKKLSDLPRAVAAGPNPAPVMGLSHILFPGGLDEKTAKHADPDTHPGFLTDILAYNIQSKEYVKVGALPKGGARVTLPATLWNNRWVIPSGESKAGVRSPKVYTISNNVQFGSLNWLFLFLYLGVMLYIGYYFSKRGKSTEDFFVAGRRIPWWAAGISIYGTQLSAISFMAIPAIVYATDWTLAIGPVIILLMVPLIIKYYLPFFRRLNVTSAYQYLEERFNLKVRLLASVTFMLMQLARMGIVLYLPAIAISSVTGLDVYLCIAIMGIFCTIYTVMGGIEAVIWTDVIQVVVLLGGAIFCIVIASLNIEGGIIHIIERGISLDKFKMLHWGWDSSQLVVWVAIISFFFLNLIPYTSDQTVVQRYLTVKDEKEAAKSLWTNGIITIPGILLFFGLGTTLYIYYLENPSIINSSKPDEVLPFYIVQNLPLGVAGIVIAGVFAASMSSLDSSMNSIATAYITDIQKRFNKNSSDAHSLKLAKLIIISIGFIGTCSAMFIAATHVDFIFNYFQEILGVFGGGLAGVFILAIFAKKANASGAIAGVLGGAALTWFVKYNTDISLYLYGAIGVVSSVMIGYLVSILFPGKRKTKIEGYTYSTLVKEEV
jgi:SSS family solute:Na+ symporter